MMPTETRVTFELKPLLFVNVIHKRIYLNIKFKDYGQVVFRTFAALLYSDFSYHALLIRTHEI